MHSNVSLYQISVTLENFRFWDHLSPKNMTRILEKKKQLKIVIGIKQCSPLQDFSQFEELKIFRQYLPQKNMNENNFEEINTKM